ncbi:MAG: hypothetical protein QW702_07880 [Candidatus Bathyarchaeia archaeon]
MRILSERQAEYIKRVILRNSAILKILIDAVNEDVKRLLEDALKKPLHEPMSRAEENVRKRLREKARNYAVVLALFALAGITINQENKNHQNLAEYIRAIMDQLYSEVAVILGNGGENEVSRWIDEKIKRLIKK